MLSRFADTIITWTWLCLAVLAGITARGGYKLGGNMPEFADHAAFLKWRRKQFWAAVGEFLSLPAFGAVWLLLDRRFHLEPEILIGGCIASGALGFGFWLEALQRLVNRRLENV